MIRPFTALKWTDQAKRAADRWDFGGQLDANRTNPIVEEAAVAQPTASGVLLHRGASLDDAGERSGPASVVLTGRAKAANPQFPEATVDAVAGMLSRPPHPTLIENNRHFHGLLTNGAPVEYQDACVRRAVGGGQGRG